MMPRFWPPFRKPGRISGIAILAYLYLGIYVLWLILDLIGSTLAQTISIVLLLLSFAVLRMFYASASKASPLTLALGGAAHAYLVLATSSFLGVELGVLVWKILLLVYLVVVAILAGRKRVWGVSALSDWRSDALRMLGAALISASAGAAMTLALFALIGAFP